LLGGSINGVPNTIADHVDGLPQKFQSISAIAPAGSFRPAAITVAMKNSTSSGNVNLNKMRALRRLRHWLQLRSQELA